MRTKKGAKQAHNYLISLGDFCTRFARINRVPRYPDGKPESDVEHSFNLAISAVELAADFYPELDVGLVAQFSLVHDFPEVYTGDIQTFNITEEDRARKNEIEKEVTKRLAHEMPPYLIQILQRYEEQVEPEARFVRYVDKITPSITNMMGNQQWPKEDYDTYDYETLMKIRSEHVIIIDKMFPEFKFMSLVCELVMKSSTNYIFDKKEKNNK